MVALYTVQGLLLLLLSVEDWRTKRVSLLPLLALTMATLGGLFFLDQDINYAMVGAILGGLVALKAVVFLSSGKPLMGNGDLILLFPLLLSLSLQDLPVFLVVAGLGGLVTAILSRQKEAPFVPALAIAYGITLVLRFVS